MLISWRVATSQGVIGGGEALCQGGREGINLQPTRVNPVTFVRQVITCMYPTIRVRIGQTGSDVPESLPLLEGSVL